MADSRIQPFLLFAGNAEEAMNFYVSLFSGSEILEIARYGANEAGVEGSVKKARFSIADESILCCDSNVQHSFSFTPAFSLFVECSSEGEMNRLHSSLMVGGTALMPLGNYGFSRQFAWVNDRYSVSWQLNLA